MGGSAYRESLEDREVEEFELHYAPETTYPPTGPTGTMAPVVHKPLRHHRIVSGTSFFLLLGAFILYLLVALSLPIIKGVYLLSLQAKVQPDQPNTSIGTELRWVASRFRREIGIELISWLNPKVRGVGCVHH